MEPIFFDQASLSLASHEALIAYDQQRYAEAGFYNFSFAAKISGPLPLSALRDALGSVRALYPKVCCHIKDVDEELHYFPCDKEEYWLEVIDAHGVAEETIQMRIKENSAKPFAIFQENLCRCYLYQADDQLHYFHVVCHHIAFDTDSFCHFVADIIRFLGTHSQNRLPYSRKDALEISYAAPQKEPSKAFWDRYLKGLPAHQTELPFCSPATGNPPVHALMKEVISKEKMERLRAFSARHSLTPFSLVTAAFQLLLSLYNQKREALISLPIRLRGDETLSPRMGYRAQLVPLYTAISGEKSLLEVAQCCKNMIDAFVEHSAGYEPLSARMHGQDSARIVVSSQRTRSDKRIVDFILGVRGATIAQDHTIWESFVEGVLPPGSSDLLLSFAEGSENFFLCFHHNKHVLGSEEASYLFTQLQQLLDLLCSNPLLSVQEAMAEKMKKSIVKGAAISLPYRSVADLFHDKCLEAAEKLAIVADERWTYRELLTRSAQLACGLQEKGIQEGDLVAVCLERTAVLLAAIFAIWQCGATFVPLDPRLPVDRRNYILSDSSAKLILTDHTTAPCFGPDVNTWNLEGVNWEAHRGGCLQHNIKQEHIAYIIYTSGTTGQPKGVSVSHGALSHFLRSLSKCMPVTKEDISLASFSISFDVFFVETFFPLVNGATVVLLPTEIAKNSQALAAAMEKYEITLLHLTPSTWQMLKEWGWEGKSNLKVCSGGDVLDSELAQFISSRVESFWNVYGPTETTVACSTKELSGKETRITIGTPIPNTAFYVLDSSKELVPLGVAGELFIGGDGLATGYLGQPQLTAEKFVTLPICGKPERLYRSGDLVRCLPNGEIEFLGRIDKQVKIRGYRIETAEIESVMRRHPAIADAAVEAVEDSSRQKKLIAYCAGTLSAKEARSYLSVFLPSYMMPSEIFFVQDLPKTIGNKIDRNALQNMYAASRQEPEHRAELENLSPIHLRLLQLFREGLEKPSFSLHDHFFEHGGYSLLAIRMVRRINKAFGMNLPAGALFSFPTVYAISELIEEHLSKINCLDTCRQKDTKKHVKAPLSHCQLPFWYEEQRNDSTTPVYPMAVRINIKGPLCVELLQKALCMMQRQHAILRTVFCEEEEGPVQWVKELNECASLLKIVPKQDYIDQASFEKTLLKEPFDLLAAPAVRVYLIEKEAEERTLYLIMHHIIGDAKSLSIFVKDLFQAYENVYLQHDWAPSVYEMQYIDFSIQQNNSLLSPRQQQAIEWWARKLQGAAEEVLLPYDFPRPLKQTFKGLTYEVTFPKDAFEALQEVARTRKCSPFIALLSAFDCLIRRYHRGEEPIIGIPTDVRNQETLEPLVGCFVSVLPYRICTNPQEGFCENLDRVSAQVKEMMQRQYVPLTEIVKKVGPCKKANSSALYNVLFNYMGSTDYPEASADLRISVEEMALEIAHLDLSLSITETSSGLRFAFEYNTDLFLEDTIKRLATHYIQLLYSIIKAPECPMQDLQLLSSQEQECLMDRWAHGVTGYFDQMPICQRFEQIVRQFPNETALIGDLHQITYRELDEMSNGIAGALEHAGVGYGDSVGICLARTPLFIAAAFAIWKIGAAYVPIDPAYSNHHIHYLCQESELKLVLTDYSSSAHLDEMPKLYLEQCPPATHYEAVDINLKDRAYIIFTSGSTGKPKGVVVSHGAIANRVAWKNSMYPLTHCDAVLHMYSFIFDGSIINYLWPLCSGSTLVVCNHEQGIDTLETIELIQKHQITVVDMLASVLHSLVQEPLFSSCHSLRHVFSGGEALSTHAVRKFYEKSSALLHNTYGPTEATVEATFWQCRHEETGAVAPIGRPLGDTSVYVLDQSFKAVPIGVVGELYIGGKALAEAYINNPRLSAEKFMKNPFSNDPEARLYKTGDLAKWHRDGYLEFAGRDDQQVKISGYRIETSAIERCLVDMDCVNEVVVVARQLPKGISQLHAYIVPQKNAQGAPGLEEQIYQHIKNHFPDYMIPRQITIVEALPRLPNGKINTLALNSNTISLSMMPAVKQPLNQVEELLHEIWTRLLKKKTLCVEESFFNLGGYSLLAVQLMAAVRKQFAVNLKLSDLLLKPTIRQLAKLIADDKQRIESSECLVPLQLVPLQSEGDAAAALYLVHPVGGNVACYQKLAAQLPKNRSVYALQAKGIEEGEVPFQNIQAMAAYYVQNLLKQNPKGPFILAGWSFGGVVAVEMAKVMEDKGKTVEHLILIDSSADWAEALDAENSVTEKGILDLISKRYGGKYAQTTDLKRSELLAELVAPGSGASYDALLAQRLISVSKAHLHALKNHPFPNYCLHCPATVIRASESLHPRKDLGWGSVFVSLKTVQIQGDHWSIIQGDDCFSLAACLKRLLSKMEKALLKAKATSVRRKAFAYPDE